MNSPSIFVALALSAGALVAQRHFVLPDYQYLCKSGTQLGNSGDTTWWRSGGGRFQILYEASHFISKAGVGGAIMIDKLMFRGEDGEPNLGTQSWVGVTVELGITSLNATTLSPTFATNRAPVFPDTTIMGPLSTHAVTVSPSAGSTPNNYNIVIDLAAVLASFPYNPLLATMPNLLIDISMPAPAVLPPIAGNVMAMQDAIGLPPVVRGRGVTSAVWNAAAGALDNPLVVGIEFSGDPGGYAPPVPARNEFYGAACGGEPSSFYQSFLNGQPFDLGGSSLMLTPNVPPPARPNFYTVTKGTTAINYLAAITKISTSDEQVVPFPLPWNFLYPGGPLAGTPTIKPCTNGYIWLDAAMVASDFSPTVGELLGALANTSRLAPFWYDFHCGRNLPTHPTSGLYADVAGFPGFRTCAVTWFNVGVFNSVFGGAVGGHAVHDMQCLLHEATGVVEFVYGPGTLIPLYCSNTGGINPSNPGIIGFSVGSLNGPVCFDPQSRDLSHELPFSTYPELSANIGLSATATPDPGGIAYSGRMFGGQTVTWHANNIPATSFVGVWVLGLSDFKPGMPFQSFLTPTQPECILSVQPDVIFGVTFPVAGTDTSPPLSIVHGWEGVNVYAQYVTFGPSYHSSNALKQTLGLD